MLNEKVSVVVPVFNAAAVLPQLVKRIEAALLGQCAAFEVILVDDGSADESWQEISTLSKRYDWLRAVKLSRNLGQYSATLLGLRIARYPVAVTMDDDLQHPPEAIPQLLAALSNEVDVVYAKPLAFRRTMYRLAVVATKYVIAGVSGAGFLRHMHSFRALRTSIYPWARLDMRDELAPDGLLKSVKPRVKVIYVTYQPRLVGASSYTFMRSCKLALRVLKSSRLPYPKGPVAPWPAISDTINVTVSGMMD